MELLQQIQRIKAMSPKPGDIIIVNVSSDSTMGDMEHLAMLLRNSVTDIGYTKEECPIIVSKSNMQISIIRKEE